MPNPQQSAANASRAAIENIIGQLQQNFTNHMWLRPANRYAADTIGRLKSDTGNPSALVCADLAEYVAASTPVHLLDASLVIECGRKATTWSGARTVSRLLRGFEVRAQSTHRRKQCSPVFTARAI